MTVWVIVLVAVLETGYVEARPQHTLYRSHAACDEARFAVGPAPAVLDGEPVRGGGPRCIEVHIRP